MVTLAGFRSVLQNKIWGGDVSSKTTVTIQNLSSSTTDSYGEEYYTYATAVATTAVPYNTIKVYNDFLNWGDRTDGETDMVFPYNTTINKHTLVLMDGVTYTVKDYEDFRYGDGVVAKVARLTEQI